MSVLLFLLALLAAAPPATRPAFRYKNPIAVEPIRDPQIIKVGDEWFMTGTASPFFPQLGQAPGIKLWSSRDLLDWKDEGLVIENKPGPWYQERFWAPELFVKDGRFYLTFNCPDKDDKKQEQQVALAVADDVRGPYTVLTADRPLVRGNDADLFEDDDGKTYLFLSGLAGYEIDLKTARLVGEKFAVVKPGGPGEWDGSTPGKAAVGLEGPFVVKFNGTYYCFYSSWARGYEVGYATAKSVRGPWTKYENNPIYGAQDAPFAARYGGVVTQDSSVPFRQVGHGSPFPGPDGTLWLSSHCYTTTADVKHPQLAVDPLFFHPDGTISVTMTWTPQAVPLTGPATQPAAAEVLSHRVAP